MQRINTPDGNWHAGDPSQGIKGTVVTMPYMQAVQEELAAIPESVGIKLDPNDNGQLVKGIKKIVSDAGTNYQPKLDYTPVQQGTGTGQGQNAVKIGWAKDGSGLRVTVDANDLGLVAFSSQLAAYATQQWVQSNAVQKTGSVMTGPLATPALQLSQGYVDGDAAKPMVYNDPSVRNVVIRTGPSTAYKYTAFGADGVLNLPARPIFNGATPWDTGNFDPTTRLWKTGDTMSGRLNLDGPNWQADLGMSDRSPNGGTWTYLRARHGGGLDVINSAYNAITFALDDYGNVFMRGQQILQPNGNLFMQWRGQWLSDYVGGVDNSLGSKANAGATCQPTGEQAEFGPLRQSTNTTLVDCPDSWVMMGLRTDNWNGDAAPRTLYIRAKRMRNQ
ncbi:hypothetical protein [Burkholderia stagnalis]|uniref:hypothetical protein n=1 Tax=Burkholderia stagnalis TaxID=1503054 RepID=UPI00163A2721|nr:hypothetical protein [Burkholderia stagnalis]